MEKREEIDIDAVITPEYEEKLNRLQAEHKAIQDKLNALDKAGEMRERGSSKLTSKARNLSNLAIEKRAEILHHKKTGNK